MTKLLSVATAAIQPDQLLDTQHLQYPRVDYIELQRILDTDILDYFAYDQWRAGQFFRLLETRLRSDVFLATVSWLKSKRYHTVFTWSERAGIPLAAYYRFFPLGTRFVTMFQCWSSRQEIAVKSLNLFHSMDSIVVHCESMRKNLISLGAPEERVKLVHYSIDQNFYRPLSNQKPEDRVILSVGESRSRDYATLFKAVRDQPLTLKVAGYGHWYAREKSKSFLAVIPENVILLKRLSQRELQNHYAGAEFVVLPIQDLIYSAGATASMEAGSMARAVIAFRSRGISDYIIDGETGILVEPGNIQAMREAIQFLLAHPEEAKRLGENARQRILDELNIETYIRKIADILQQK